MVEFQTLAEFAQTPGGQQFGDQPSDPALVAEIDAHNAARGSDATVFDPAMHITDIDDRHAMLVDNVVHYAREWDQERSVGAYFDQEAALSAAVMLLNAYELSRGPLDDGGDDLP